jgi:hypothetical protein
MIVVVRVTGRSLPPGVSIDSLVLVRGAEEWSGQARAESANDSMASSIEFVSRNGPEWPTGTTMDVIARIRIPGRDRVVLRAAGVRIERVD